MVVNRDRSPFCEDYRPSHPSTLKKYWSMMVPAPSPFRCRQTTIRVLPAAMKRRRWSVNPGEFVPVDELVIEEDSDDDDEFWRRDRALASR